MKKMNLLFRLFFLFSFLVFISGTGCEKEIEDDNVANNWVLTLDDEQNIINKTVDGIEFTFCLLNEEGEPSKTFKEGENFFIKFSMKNNRNEDLYYYSPVIFDDENDFFKIFSEENKSFGKPFKAEWVMAIGIGAFPFNNDNPVNITFPWVYERAIWDSLFVCYPEGDACVLDYVIFEPSNTSYLAKGKYYSSFSRKFEFQHPNKLNLPDFETDTITFRIDFEVK